MGASCLTLWSEELNGARLPRMRCPGPPRVKWEVLNRFDIWPLWWCSNMLAHHSEYQYIFNAIVPTWYGARSPHGENTSIQCNIRMWSTEFIRFPSYINLRLIGLDTQVPIRTFTHYRYMSFGNVTGMTTDDLNRFYSSCGKLFIVYFSPSWSFRYTLNVIIWLQWIAFERNQALLGGSLALMLRILFVVATRDHWALSFNQ